MAQDKLSQIIDDIEAHRQRTGSASEIASKELRTELSMNLWPLMRSLALELKERIEAHDEGFAELARREESFIQAELAGDILGALDVGRQICVRLLKILKEGAVPEGKDRDGLIKQVAAYLDDTRQLADEVSSVAVEIEDPEDDEGEEYDDEYGEDDGGGDLDQPTEFPAYEIDDGNEDDDQDDDADEEDSDEER